MKPTTNIRGTTDETKLVSRARRSVQNSNRLFWIHLTISMLLVGSSIWLWNVVSLSSLFDETAREEMKLATRLGLFVGGITGLTLVKVVFYIAEAIRLKFGLGYERLILDYQSNDPE